MSLDATSQNLVFADKYSIDKIVGVFVGSFDASQTSVLGSYLYQFTFSHSFNRPVFCELLWSTDGSNYVYGGSGVISGARGISYSDTNNIYVTTGINIGTIYYKVIASWIDNYDDTNPSISPSLSTNNGLYFDSRQNYEKVYLQNQIMFSGVSPTQIIGHFLSYTPNAKVFFESITGQVWPAISGGASDYFYYNPGAQCECIAIIDNTKLSINLVDGTNNVSARAWYRIYLND